MAWVLQRVFAKLCVVLAWFLSCCFTMARTFTQDEVDAIVDRAVQAVRRENETLRAELWAAMETIARLEARVRLEVAWRAAILAGRAQTPSNHGGLLTGRCLP